MSHAVFLENPEQMLCIEYVKNGLDYWFPSQTQTARPSYAKAREICASCPVVAKCLAATINMAELPIWGIWAGKTASEIAQLADRTDEWRQCAYPLCEKKFYVFRKRSARKFCNSVCAANNVIHAARLARSNIESWEIS
jgi:hypothetical protein